MIELNESELEVVSGGDLHIPDDIDNVDPTTGGE